MKRCTIADHVCENGLIPCTVSIPCCYLSDHSQAPSTVLFANLACHSSPACKPLCAVKYGTFSDRSGAHRLIMWQIKDIQSGFCKFQMSHGHFHAGWFCYHHKDGWSCKGRRCPQCCCSHQESYHVPWYRYDCSADDNQRNSDALLFTAAIIKGNVNSEHVSLQSMYECL